MTSDVRQAVSESVAHALTQSLQQAMVSRYREVFSSTALPAFERSTRELLHQINGTFSAGTKECEYWQPGEHYYSGDVFNKIGMA